ncbi:copia protein [Tanacetum coccineum]
MVVEMEDMTKKAPLGIVENILVKIDKFLFHYDFVVIDMLEGLNETMLLGRPFLVTIHAQIDIFRREISLGIDEEKVKFDMNGGICHFRVPVEIFYMESSVKECENFNLLKLKMMYSLMIPLRACYWSKEVKGSNKQYSDNLERESKERKWEEDNEMKLEYTYKTPTRHTKIHLTNEVVEGYLYPFTMNDHGALVF